MKTKLYTTEGDEGEEIDLPEVFEYTYRPDLIRRAFLSSQANEKQPYGTDSESGLDTSAESWGAGRGVAQIPRLKNSDRAARVPQATGGRRAHPPKPEKDLGEKINKKEKDKALKSAISSTLDEELVQNRGHVFESDLPIVLDSEFEELQKTKEVVNILKELGLHGDIERSDEGRKIRSGKGKMRGRKYRQPTSILFVTSDEFRAARNLPGADVIKVDNLGVKHLAPGGVPGRLTVWTESSVKYLEEKWS